MNTKNILSAVLIIFVVVSLGFLFAKESDKKQTSTSPDNSTLPEEVTTDNPETTPVIPEALPDNPETSPDIPSDDIASQDADIKDKTIVYYFHVTKRCVTCLRIEKYTKEAIITGFLPEMTIGKLEFSSINTDLPENQHFLIDFEQSSRSAVLVHMVGGEVVKWKNLVRVWELNKNKEEFFSYITQETREFLDSQNE